MLIYTNSNSFYNVKPCISNSESEEISKFVIRNGSYLNEQYYVMCKILKNVLCYVQNIEKRIMSSANIEKRIMSIVKY